MTAYRTLQLSALVLVWTASFRASHLTAADDESDFSRTSVDIGLVVRDVDRAAEFYTDAIGFREAEGFAMSGELARSIGLTEGASLEVRVLVLGEERSATRLKLIELPDAAIVKSPGRVDSGRRGIRYMTVFVSDTDAALQRLEDAGVEPAAGPVGIGDGPSNEVSVMLVLDPEGNLVELVGPRSGNGPSE